MQRLSFFTGLVLLLITGMASVLVTPMTADAQTPEPTIIPQRAQRQNNSIGTGEQRPRVTYSLWIVMGN